MAMYHLSAKIIGRQGGQRAEKRAKSRRTRKSATNAVAAAAYRSGERLYDERTGSTYRYARSERVMHTEIIAPGDAPAWSTDRAQLWNSVEAHEKRKDAQLAREIEVALPQELDLDQQRELLRGWVSREFIPSGAVVDFAIHHDRENRNPHAHIMISVRAIDGDGWSKLKIRHWDDRSVLAHWRESWADHVNTALEQHGHDERVDHRSYFVQDADKPEDLKREPTLKVGPWARGRDREVSNRLIKERNYDRIKQWLAQVADRARAALNIVPERAPASSLIADLKKLAVERQQAPISPPVHQPKSIQDLVREHQIKEAAKAEAKAEAERQAKLEAERKARAEAERQAKLEAERKARAEAERQAKLEAERKARAEAERQAQAEAARQAALIAKAEAKRKAAEAQPQPVLRTAPTRPAHIKRIDDLTHAELIKARKFLLDKQLHIRANASGIHLEQFVSLSAADQVAFSGGAGLSDADAKALAAISKRIAALPKQPVHRSEPAKPEPQIEATAQAKPALSLDDVLTPAQLWHLSQRGRDR